MSDKCIRSVSAPAMAGYQDLSDFERGVIIGAREMGHSISEVSMKLGFSRTIISRVYREYRISGKTSNFLHWCGRLETTLTGDRHLSILPDHLHSFMPIVHSDGLGQFQQDNATPHASRFATKWL
ncbi:hypothetical protein AVEN_66854-1 [Araneus ventricosus]|uniref:Tc3 transposase DNA binding domain-containing protein n=1 Tax=Araneus ventricosus TaxID=182803 RepID=A0A4Y2UGZ0_ARAVE|nr:hypothetical protein AVEN_66854-1 [Araneus ventricosus]